MITCEKVMITCETVMITWRNNDDMEKQAYMVSLGVS